MPVEISDLRFRDALIDIAYAAMIVRSLEGSRVLYWNHEAEVLYGWSKEEALGQVSHALLKTRFPEPLAQIEATVRTAGRWQGEIEHTTRDGRRLILMSRWALQRDDAGQPAAILEVNLDITEQRQTEAERARLEHEAAAKAEAEETGRRFAFLAEASAILAGSLDYETTLARVARLAVPYIADWCAIDMLADDGSVQLLAVAHVDPQKVRWAADLRRQHPIDMEAPAGLAQVLRTGQPELYSNMPDEMSAAAAEDEEQLAFLRAIGYNSLMLVPLTVRGRVLGAITLVAAESGRHYGPADLNLAQNLARHAGMAIESARLYRQVQNLNEDLQRRANRLEAANKELEAFAYSVSHDLRAPLRAIDGFSRILTEEYAGRLEPDAQHYLDMVRNNAQQMGHLIDDLLAFSRLGRQSLAKHLVQPADVARQALDELESECEGRQVEVVIGDLPACQADPTLLKQVFVNLLSNALKFTRRREVARIEVGCQQQDGETVYFVKDNGVGFDMQYVGKLFGVFQRLHRAEDYEGTGAGLAIVQRIIHRHGGRVWAEGALDQGATFYFTI